MRTVEIVIDGLYLPVIVEYSPEDHSNWEVISVTCNGIDVSDIIEADLIDDEVMRHMEEYSPWEADPDFYRDDL